MIISTASIREVGKIHSTGGITGGKGTKRVMIPYFVIRKASFEEWIEEHTDLSEENINLTRNTRKYFYEVSID